MRGIDKLACFFNKYPLTVVWFPFCLLGIVLSAYTFQSGEKALGIVLILVHVPWLWAAVSQYVEFMKNLD